MRNSGKNNTPLQLSIQSFVLVVQKNKLGAVQKAKQRKQNTKTKTN